MNKAVLLDDLLALGALARGGRAGDHNVERRLDRAVGGLEVGVGRRLDLAARAALPDRRQDRGRLVALGLLNRRRVVIAREGDAVAVSKGARARRPARLSKPP